ncbi:MAG: hypothetical protein MRJ92_03195 [Nitrospira sp.]|nr:hypothetical protein [Nitrospira sp.]
MTIEDAQFEDPGSDRRCERAELVGLIDAQPTQTVIGDPGRIRQILINRSAMPSSLPRRAKS